MRGTTPLAVVTGTSGQCKGAGGKRRGAMLANGLGPLGSRWAVLGAGLWALGGRLAIVSTEGLP